MIMKNILLKGLCLLFIYGLISCAAEKVKPKMTYYHGLKPFDLCFTIVDYTAEEIEFKIRINFNSLFMYHLILEGNEPLAEGWYSTLQNAEEGYRVKIKAKRGVVFQPRKTYRLCIGSGSPEEAARYRNSYRCLAEYEFVLPQK